MFQEARLQLATTSPQKAAQGGMERLGRMGDEHLNPYTDHSISLPRLGLRRRPEYSKTSLLFFVRIIYIPSPQPSQTNPLTRPNGVLKLIISHYPSHIVQASSSLFVSQRGSDLLSVACKAMLASTITVVFHTQQGDLVIAPASNLGLSSSTLTLL
jgi:hypothetical protein